MSIDNFLESNRKIIEIAKKWGRSYLTVLGPSYVGVTNGVLKFKKR